MIKQHKINIESKFTPFIKLIMIVFCAIFVFGSIDVYRSSDSTIFLNKIFIQPFWKSHFFSLLEITFIILVLTLIHKYCISYHETNWKLKFIFWLAIVVFILKMLNPNNNSSNPILGMPLFSEISNYTFLLLIYFSFFLKREYYIKIIKKLFFYVGIILTLRMIFLFLLWSIGKGNYSFGANATINESDTLFLIAFYQIIFFSIYLITHTKKYLFLSIFYFLFQVLSYRRSALGVALAANLILYISFLLKDRSLKKKIMFVLFMLVLITAFRNVREFNLPGKYERYVLRFVSAIPGFAEKNSREFNDSGHWEQTTETFYSAIHTLGFWGVGYGKSSEAYLQGQSAVVHNVYAAAWLFYGFYMVLFILLLILMTLFKSINIFFTKNLSNSNILIQFSISMYLLAWFAVISTNPLMVFNSFKMELLWVTLFSIMFRLDISEKNILDGGNI